MVTCECSVANAGGVTLVEAVLRADASTLREVTLAAAVPGPVWPPRRDGVAERDWTDGELAVRVPADGRVAVGFATPAESREPPVAVVEDPAPTALANAVRTRELARELDAGLRAVILNRENPEKSHGDVRALLGAPVTAVPESEALAAAQPAGHQVAAVRPDAPAASPFRELAPAIGSGRSGRSVRR